MFQSTSIPFNRPYIASDGLFSLQDALARLHHSGDGHYTQKCQAWLEKNTSAKKALLTTSCTHALEMCALLLDLRSGDEVIVPSFTFVSTVNAFVLRGCVPVFADIRPDTLNLDERLLPKLLTSRTKAIVPVHYGGIACEMDALCAVARQHGVPVVEDNAHGLLGQYRGKPLGSFGVLATQSFHETKNFSCGEGGALLINGEHLIERAEIIREKGTNRSRFFRGQVDKYTWVDVGSSYLPSDLLAALLWSQFSSSVEIQSKREFIWKFYDSHLRDWARECGYTTPIVPTYCVPAWHLYYLLLPNLTERQDMISHLKAQGISAVFHYLPLHLSSFGQQFGGKIGDCPVTESVSDRLIRLPFFTGMSEAELERIVATIKSFSKNRPPVR